MRITFFQFRYHISIAAAICVLLAPFFSSAQEAQRLTVTPPLYQLSIEPGTLWQSTLKVVNSNSYPLTVYAEVVDFASEGEAGQGVFKSVDTTDEDKLTLAEWINIASGPFVIEPERSYEIPFFVEVPREAAPGGHYAAILVSTEPPNPNGEISVLTTQTITSLLFTRVEGDVVENATIREFSTNKMFVATPDVEFSLRVENKGNVHIQPRGNIVITNMWGKERGTIPINSQGQYGNVLPRSIRDFRYLWSSERSLTDIGRYKAEVTIGYGQSEIQNTSAATYFWVLPVKGALITVGVLAAVIFFITWMIKLYVRRMLLLAGVPVDDGQRVVPDTKAVTAEQQTPQRTKINTLTLPIRSGSRDLTNRLRSSNQFIDVIKTLFEFVWAYKRFFMAVILLVICFVLAMYYITEVTIENRDYEVRVKEGNTERILVPDDSNTGSE